MRSILITGARAPAALDLARKFKTQGFRVIVADSIKPNITMYSNSISKFYFTPKPNEDFKGFISSLVKIVKKEKIDLIIPTCEEIFFVSKGKSDLEKYTRVFCEDIDRLRVLHNKFEFIEISKKFGLSVPKTTIINSSSELKKSYNGGKFVLKKIYSRFANGVFFSKNGKMKKELPFDKKNPWIKQEFIEGSQYCTYSVVNKGKVSAHSCYPVEFKLGKGASLNFTNVKNIKIQKWVEKFVKKYNFTGQIAFDFIVRNGAAYVIECNPRSTSGIHIFRDEDRLDLAFFGESEKVTHASGGDRMIGVGMLFSFFNNVKDFKSLRKWVIAFRKSKDIIYSSRDKAPFYKQFWVFLCYIFFSIRNRTSINEVTTKDIEWNGI